MVLFRTRLRRNNIETILVAETKMCDLFFARNHPVYREIKYEFFKLETLMPKQVKDVLHTFLAVSRTSYDFYYKRGDAIFEENNKSGVPGYKQWQGSVWNMDDLSRVSHILIY